MAEKFLFEQKLVTFVSQYEKISLNIIAEYFFPLPPNGHCSSYADYFAKEGEIERVQQTGWQVAGIGPDYYMVKSHVENSIQKA